MTTANLPGGQMTQVTCQRAIPSNFESGVQDFSFSVGAPTCISPSQSYFVMDVTLQYNNRQPFVEDKVAFSRDPVSCMYSEAQVRMGGQDISNINSYLPQASIIQKRLFKSGAWLDSVGSSAYMLDSSFEERVKLTAYDGSASFSTTENVRVDSGATPTVAITTGGVVTGVNTLFNTLLNAGDYICVNGLNLRVSGITNDTTAAVEVIPNLAATAIATTSAFEVKREITTNVTQGNNRVQIVWQPPVGFFNYKGVLGSGNYRITLSPLSNYKKACVEALADLTVGTGSGEYDVIVNDMILYVATYKHVIEHPIINMPLKEVEINSKTLSGGSETFQFTLPPSTFAIAMYVQANAASGNNLYPPSKFWTASNEQDDLTSYSITYANVTKTETRFPAYFDVIGTYPNQTNRLALQQRYHDCYRESGMADLAAGCEKLSQYIDGGMMIYHNWITDSENQSTQCQVSITNSNSSYTTPTKLHLVAFYSRQIEVVTDNGLITSVRQLAIK